MKKIKVEVEVPDHSEERVIRALKLIEMGAWRDPIFLKSFVNYMEGGLQVKSGTEIKKGQS